MAKGPKGTKGPKGRGVANKNRGDGAAAGKNNNNSNKRKGGNVKPQGKKPNASGGSGKPGRGRVNRSGGRGGRGGRGGNRPKPKTAEDLDREMDSYWGKSAEHAAKKLDGDMDDYWQKKDEPSKDDEVTAAEPAEEELAAEEE